MPIPVQSAGLLITADDVQAWIDGLSDAKAASIAQMASAEIRAYCKQSILLDQYTETLRVSADIVDHPDISGAVGVVRPRQRPVTAVLSVVADDETLTSDRWTWDETRGEILLDDPTFYAAEITYTAGYTTTPDDVRSVALSLAMSLARNPAGVQSERLADYSVTYAGNGLGDRHKAILNAYLPSASTVRPS